MGFTLGKYLNTSDLGVYKIGKHFEKLTQDLKVSSETQLFILTWLSVETLHGEWDPE